jgi:hypothetical protein
MLSYMGQEIELHQKPAWPELGGSKKECGQLADDAVGHRHGIDIGTRVRMRVPPERVGNAERQSHGR